MEKTKLHKLLKPTSILVGYATFDFVRIIIELHKLFESLTGSGFCVLIRPIEIWKVPFLFLIASLFFWFDRVWGYIVSLGLIIFIFYNSYYRWSGYTEEYGVSIFSWAYFYFWLTQEFNSWNSIRLTLSLLMFVFIVIYSFRKVRSNLLSIGA